MQRFGATKTEAERNLRAALEERPSAVEGEELIPTTTVAEAAEHWRTDTATKDKHSASTLRTYGVALGRHIIGTPDRHGPIAMLRLREVTAPRVERALQAVADHAGDGMAKTVRTVYRHIFGLAVYQGAIKHNPVSDVRTVKARGSSEAVPAGERDTSRAFTEAELEAVLSTAEADTRAGERDLPDVLHFLAGTGLRIGEACAVRWADVDLDAATALVGTKTVERVKGEGLRISEHGATKMHARVIPLPPSLVARLRVRHERMAGRANPHGVLFPAPLSTNVRDPSNTAHHVRDLLDTSGMPWATAHTFRKTVATRLHDAGMSDRQVSNYMGHSRIGTTQDHYLDRRQPVLSEAAEVLDRARLREVS